MIIVLPDPDARERGARTHPGFAWPYAMEHRKRELLPGGFVHELLSRPREAHLHALHVERETLVTATLHASRPLELWLLHGDHKPICGPTQQLQEVLGDGIYWLQVRARPPGRGPGGGYRLGLHCVPL